MAGEVADMHQLEAVPQQQVGDHAVILGGAVAGRLDRPGQPVPLGRCLVAMPRQRHLLTVAAPIVVAVGIVGVGAGCALLKQGHAVAIGVRQRVALAQPVHPARFLLRVADAIAVIVAQHRHTHRRYANLRIGVVGIQGDCMSTHAQLRVQCLTRAHPAIARAEPAKRARLRDRAI